MSGSRIDITDAPSTARDVLTHALRALKKNPYVAILGSIIYPLLDIIDKMQILGSLHDVEQTLKAKMGSSMTASAAGRTGGIAAQGGEGEGSKFEINVHGSGHTINISGGTGGTGGAGNVGGQGGTGGGPVITVQSHLPQK